MKKGSLCQNFSFSSERDVDQLIKLMVFLGQVQDRRPQEMNFPVGTFRLGA